MGTDICTDIYDYCDDPALKRRAGMFLDLVWAQWAQEQLATRRGGAKTRCRRFSGHDDAMVHGCRLLLGGPTRATDAWYGQLVSEYRLPAIVWELALDNRRRGVYAYRSRRIGEENPDYWPRPPGTERTLLCDTESRLLRESWITPEAIMGCQMDHPGALHSHLSLSNRWCGVIFANSADAMVAPSALKQANDDWAVDANGVFRAAQHRNVMIVQQARRFNQRNPDWFPAYPRSNLPWGVIFESTDETVEKDGWIFARQGKAYVAVRPLRVTYTYGSDWNEQTTEQELLSIPDPDSYQWNADHTIAVLHDQHSPVIFELGREDEFGSFGSFQDRIRANEIRLKKVVVPGWFTLVYQGCDPDAAEITFSAANSQIPQLSPRQGQRAYLDYSPRLLLNSPYLHSAYNSGVVRISSGENRVDLNFSEVAVDR
ncbi:hypothetical protein OAS39_01410 [Pirellulales bacterium]|nr:hypothetical protein [Pirellulales bacterium]